MTAAGLPVARTAGVHRTARVQAAVADSSRPDRRSRRCRRYSRDHIGSTYRRSRRSRASLGSRNNRARSTEHTSNRRHKTRYRAGGEVCRHGLCLYLPSCRWIFRSCRALWLRDDSRKRHDMVRKLESAMGWQSAADRPWAPIGDGALAAMRSHETLELSEEPGPNGMTEWSEKPERSGPRSLRQPSDAARKPAMQPRLRASQPRRGVSWKSFYACFGSAYRARISDFDSLTLR